MANQIQATVYQIDGNPQKTPISLSFLTSDIAMREFSGSNIPEVQSAILYYPNASNPLELQTFYVSESMATLLAAANLGITSQVQATILAINENPLSPAGITYSFPASGVSIWTNVDETTGVNSYLQFKNTRYFASQTEAYLSALANQNQGGSGTVTSIVAGTGITVDSSTPASPVVSIGYVAEDVANKSLNVATDGSSDVKYPSVKAAKTYTDSLVVGLLNDRGNYTPGVTSPGAFPTTGGSGTAGAIKKGDLWYCSANGYMGTTAVVTGVSFRALIDTPGQTAANWNILNVGLGFTPENVLNKSTSGALGTSDTLYPSQQAVKTYVDTNNTLQVTTAGTNKNLTNGRNYQGTDAGSGTIGGTDINGFGASAAAGSTGSYVNALGNLAANLNTGGNVNALGRQSAQSNSGSYLNAIGFLAANLNTAQNVNALGRQAAQSNIAQGINALGYMAAQNNSGEFVNALGQSSAKGNSGSFVNALGSSAALNNSGWHVNGLGSSAANANTGTNVNALGSVAGYQNTGSDVNGLGANAARVNTGGSVNALGSGAAQQNSGSYVNALGYNTARDNSGSTVNALGFQAANGNSANDVNALGSGAGLGNAYSNVSLLGLNAAAGAPKQLVLSDGTNNARISHITLSDNRTYELPDADGTLALVNTSAFSGTKVIGGQTYTWTNGILISVV